jgi:hypothetical protein
MSMDDDTAVGPQNIRVREAVEFVKLGYGDNFGLSFRSLYFRTEELTTAEAQAAMRTISYDGFDGNKVAEAIEQFRGKFVAYEFGREGSPVLYVCLPYWTHQREGEAPSKMGTRIDNAEIDMLVAKLKDTLVGKLHADEFDIVEMGWRKVRAWWD